MLAKLESEKLSRLTSREKEVFALISKGLTNKLSAELLGISKRTVEIHRANILKKYQARNVVQLNHMLTLLDQDDYQASA
ncbi:LuxR C-terminal-related transcriptional regulator [Brackiella oedipodis]|uniref:LuxR C-terminal-related transcriptional regulator n=1 Tax=Brackiella oedipodis TaxID=124225 RepID=UPI0005705DE1|nr:LuxR C-terminal-related transcriptional regulator [Brackiella oedipodis]